MNKLSPVQIVLMFLAGISLIVAVLVFSFSRDRADPNSDVKIVLWGTMDSDTFGSALSKYTANESILTRIIYEEKDPQTLEEDFVRALAEGEGPDLIMLNQDQLIENEKKLLTIPYDSLPLRDYVDTYIPEAEMFTTSEGILGIPFLVDPMVMYWNRTLFAKEGISSPPRFWSEVMEITPRLTKSDAEHTISESAIALGEIRNITHAKEIFLNLLLQAGNDVVVRSSGESSGYDVILQERLGYTIAPTVASLNFFTQFSNPARDVYSWNRALPSSQTQFLAGDLAMYLGFASEISDIRAKNPNLDFDITTVPQSQNSPDRKVFGKMTVLAIARSAKNPLVAFNTAKALTASEVLESFQQFTNLPPVRRDMLQANPSDRFQSVLFTSALWSRGVLEISPSQTTPIFQNMIESFTTGRLESGQAIQRAQEEMELLLNKI